MEEPAESTAIRNNFNISNPSKPVMENTETENKLEFGVSTFRFRLSKGLVLLSTDFHPVSILTIVRSRITHPISQCNRSNPDKIFASSLFASGHGYPLYYPDTILGLDDDFRSTRGISIGDVGFLGSKNQLIFQFSIFLPADHPNKNNVPESFVLLCPLQEPEIYTTADYFPRGYVVASKGVNVTRHSEDPL